MPDGWNESRNEIPSGKDGGQDELNQEEWQANEDRDQLGKARDLARGNKTLQRSGGGFSGKCRAHSKG